MRFERMAVMVHASVDTHDSTADRSTTPNSWECAWTGEAARLAVADGADRLTLAGRALQARGRGCLNRRLYQRRIQTDAAATQPYPRGYQQ